MNKTAILIGATGLTGKNILEYLCSNENYSKVKVFTRKNIEYTNTKIEQFVINFDNIYAYSEYISGHELYSALGTTLKKAGSKENQYKVDFTYQYVFAEIAAKNGVQKYLLISSIGASENSPFFYARMKGKLETSVKKLNFGNIFIFRPSGLKGKRNEVRKFESAGIFIMKIFTILPFLRKYKPIKALYVAKAAVLAANKNFNEKIRIFESDEIYKISKQ